MTESTERDAPRAVFGKPVDWDKLTPKQKTEWALGLIRNAKDIAKPAT